MHHRKLIAMTLISLVLFGAIIAGVFYTLKNGSAIRKDAEITIGKTIITAEIANTEAERDSGLGGRNELGQKQGMYFMFGEPVFPAFWMKDMKFPIDIVWIKESKVIGTTKNIDPQIGALDDELKLYEPPDFIDNALELRAGAVNELGIKIGDSVSVEVLSAENSK